MDSDKLFLRKAIYDDADLLYNWRNDEIVRLNSFNTKPIKYEEHIKWLEKTLKNKDEQLFILIDNEVEIGQVRLSIQTDIAEISYSIDNKYRTLGYGKIILRLVENEILHNKLNVFLLAYVKKHNIASQIIFENLGYSCTEKENCYEYRKQPEYNDDIGKVRKFAGGGTFLNE